MLLGALLTADLFLMLANVDKTLLMQLNTIFILEFQVPEGFYYSFP